MVLFNYSTKELTAKVVYYGPGLCGKTTNLQWIHEKLPIKNKGKMLSLATETDRTLFFDFLPIELGTIRGMKTRIQLYTVPGQVFYNATRRMVLKGADCVVFVCDSQEAMLDANLESFENLRQNLEANEIDPDEVPMVLQYNKRDLPNALPIEILNERMNPRGLPFFEAVAVKGVGVEETLKGVTGLVFRSLATKYGGAEPAAPAKTAAPAAPPRPAAAPPPPQPPPPRAGTATLPPVNLEAEESAPSMLDSLELEPTTEPSLDAEVPIEIGMDAGADEEEVVEEFDTLPVEPEAVVDEPPRPRVDPKQTLVSSEKEAQELRRRISRPISPEVAFEQIEDAEEPEEIEEISLDSEPAPPPPRPSRAVPAPPRPAPAAAPVTPAPARPAPAPAPVAAAAPARAVAQAVESVPPRPRPAEVVSSVSATPVSVQLQGVPSQTEVAIPVEVNLIDGVAQVTIHLRLTLNIKLQR